MRRTSWIVSGRSEAWRAGVRGGARLIFCALAVSLADAGRPAMAQGAGRSECNMQTVDGLRKYVIHVPANYDGATARPAVVVLHGSGGTANDFIDEAHWAQHAEQSGFLVIAPEGLPLRPNLPAAPLANPRLWNSGQYSALHPHGEVDDVTFIIGCLDDARQRWLIDPQRTFVAGYSSGGSMAYRLVCERGDRFAGMASVGGLPWVTDRQPVRPVPTLAIHGTLDPLVPLTGGVKVLPWDVRPTPPVSSAHQRWAAAIGSPYEANELEWSPGADVSARDYGPGPGGAVLRAYYVGRQGHAWPGASTGLRPERLLGPDLNSFDATGAIWAFFSQWYG